MAAACGATFVIAALALCAICRLPHDVILGVLPRNAQPFASLLVVPAPLMAMFLAVVAMQASLRDPKS